MTREIQDERDHELTNNSPLISREGCTRESLASSFLPVGSTGREDGAIYLGEAFDPSEIAAARRLKQGLRDPAVERTPDPVIAQILRYAAAQDGPKAPLIPNSRDIGETWDQENSRLRKRIKKLVAVIHHKTGIEYADIHNRWKAEGGSRHDGAGNEELKQKLQWLGNWLNRLKERPNPPR
jgi:hypothetical protein